jgi:hypothetical protein
MPAMPAPAVDECDDRWWEVLGEAEADAAATG